MDRSILQLLGMIKLFGTGSLIDGDLLKSEGHLDDRASFIYTLGEPPD